MDPSEDGGSLEALGLPDPKKPLAENSEHREVSHLIEQQKIYRSICAPSGGSEVSGRYGFQKTNMGF